jgi:hypothetical protein
MSREFSNMQFDAAVNKAIFGADYLDPSGIFVPIIKGPHVGNTPGETERTFPAVLDISNNYEIRGSLNIKTEQIKGTSYSKDSIPDFSDQNVWLNYGQNTTIPNSSLFPGLVVGGPSTTSNSNNAFIWAKRLIQNQNGYGVSDRRIKTNIKLSNYEEAYNKVSDLSVNSYDYIDNSLNSQPFGFLADEVRSIYSSAVIDICGNFTETGALIAPFDNSSNPVLSDLTVIDKNSLFQLLFAAFKHSQNKISDLESNALITLDSGLSSNLVNLQNLIKSQKIILGLGATTSTPTFSPICARHLYGKSYKYDRLANIYLQYDPGTFQDDNKDILDSLSTLPSNYNVDYASAYNGIDNSRKYEFDVFIGGPTNSANLYSFGDIISFYSGPSDQRIKQNITTASTSDAYNLVSQFSLKSYDYVDISRNSTEYGFIAQEIETIFPSAVKTCEGNFTFKGAKIASDDETTTTDFTDMKLLNKDKIMQLLFAAFQESQIKIADLERRLNAIGA